jgi:hypothetical protein
MYSHIVTYLFTGAYNYQQQMRNYSNCWRMFIRNGKYKKKVWHGLKMWSQWNETIMKSGTRVLRKKRKLTERTPCELHKKIIIHWYSHKSELYHDMAYYTLRPPIQTVLSVSHLVFQVVYLAVTLKVTVYMSKSKYCQFYWTYLIGLLPSLLASALPYCSITPQLLHLKHL